MGSNRGVLPFHILREDDRLVRLLVPLPANETLWIAWTVKPGLRVFGYAADRRPVRIAPVAQSLPQWSLLTADALVAPDGRQALDARSLTLASAPEKLGDDHLHFDVRDDAGTVGSIGVVVSTTELYAHLSGLPAPAPSGPTDAYTGWRLP